MIGIWQLVLILVIVLVLFGAGRVPRIMRDLGSGLRAFKDGLEQEGENKDEGRGIDMVRDKSQISSKKKVSKNHAVRASKKSTKKNK